MVTYGNIDAQMKGMIEAWGWTSSDVILHVLPLHHVHGVVNVLMTSLYTGATCKMMANFDAKQVIKLSQYIIFIIFLPVNLDMCSGCSKEPSQ